MIAQFLIDKINNAFLNFFRSTGKVFFLKVMASGGLYFYYLHQQFTVLNKIRKNGHHLVKKPFEIRTKTIGFQMVQF